MRWKGLRAPTQVLRLMPSCLGQASEVMDRNPEDLLWMTDPARAESRASFSGAWGTGGGFIKTGSLPQPTLLPVIRLKTFIKQIDEWKPMRFMGCAYN